MEVSLDLVLGGRLGDALDYGLGTRDSVNRHDVKRKAHDVGCGHGRSRDDAGVLVASVPRRLDAAAGGKHLDDLAPVGVAGDAPVRVNRTDGEGARRRGRGPQAGVGVGVTAGGDGQDAQFGGRVDGAVEGVRDAAAERHVDDGLGVAALGDDVVGGKVEAVQDGRSRRRAALEDLDGQQLHLLGDAVSLAANGARDVGAVTIRVRRLVLERAVDG